MTREEEKIFLTKFDEFIKETRDNFAQLFLDRENDHKLWEEIYKAVGANTSVTNLAVGKVEEATKKVEDNTKKVVKQTDQLKEDIAGKTKMVYQETDKPKKRTWQIWIDKIKNRKEV